MNNDSQNIDETLEMLQGLIDKQDRYIQQTEDLLDVRKCITELQLEQNKILLNQNKWLKNALMLTWALYIVSILIILWNEKA